MRLLRSALVGALLLVLGMTSSAPPASASRQLPPRNADWDYQLGGTVRPADRVQVVVRDRKAEPSRASYDVCYVNAFQTQPDERLWWRDHPARWRLVLRDHGRPVVDEAWGEWLLDLRTPTRRHALARIVGRWVAGCARQGFSAVELDNLDSFSRSHGLLSGSDARHYARLLVRRAHRAGLAVAQKNWSELGPRGPRLGFDLAVAEECGRWHECGSYARAYDDRVLVVEYRRRDFTRTCARWGARLSVVLRDRDLTPRGVRRWC